MDILAKIKYVEGGLGKQLTQHQAYKDAITAAEKISADLNLFVKAYSTPAKPGPAPLALLALAKSVPQFVKSLKQEQDKKYLQ